MFTVKSVECHPLLERSLSRETYSDIVFRAADGDGVQFQKLLFASVSPLLSKVFEDVPSYPTAIVIIPDADEQSLTNLLDFVQSEEITFSSESSYSDLLELMHLLGIDYVNKCIAVAEEEQCKASEAGEESDCEVDLYQSVSVELDVASSDSSRCNSAARPSNNIPQPPVFHNDNSSDIICLEDDGEKHNNDTKYQVKNSTIPQPPVFRDYSVAGELHNNHVFPRPPVFSDTDHLHSDENGTASNHFMSQQTSEESTNSTIPQPPVFHDSSDTEHHQSDNKRRSKRRRLSRQASSESEQQPEFAELIHSCQYCTSCFSAADHLERHVKRRHVVGQFSCDLCSLTFSVKRNLMQHIRSIHENTISYPCDLCSKTFNKKGNLEIHRKGIHLKLKPFKCDHCQATFSKRYTLETHERIHTGEKPFCCGLCGRKFSKSGALKSHEVSAH